MRCDGPMLPIDLDHPPVVHLLNPGRFDVGAYDYCLSGLWAIHFYRYDAGFWLDGQSIGIRKRSIGLTPPGGQTRYIFRGESPHLCAHFSLPVVKKHSGCVAAMVRDHPRFDKLEARLATAVPTVHVHPAHAAAVLWGVLWELLIPSPVAGRAEISSGDRAVDRAVTWVELNLHNRISVSDVIAEVDVSHNHLTRLFRQRFGETIVAFIRRRRVERAMHLLKYTTQPIKVIAAEVGLADLQKFNKTLRNATGSSPTALRANARASKRPQSRDA